MNHPAPPWEEAITDRPCSDGMSAGILRVTWTPETEPVLMRASLPARLGQEKPHETQAPHSRADHPQAAHR